MYGPKSLFPCRTRVGLPSVARTFAWLIAIAMPPIERCGTIVAPAVPATTSKTTTTKSARTRRSIIMAMRPEQAVSRRSLIAVACAAAAATYVLGHGVESEGRRARARNRVAPRRGAGPTEFARQLAGLANQFAAQSGDDARKVPSVGRP